MGARVLFPPPMQLLRRKEVHFWDSIDDPIRSSRRDPVLANGLDDPRGPAAPAAYVVAAARFARPDGELRCDFRGDGRHRIWNRDSLISSTARRSMGGRRQPLSRQRVLGSERHREPRRPTPGTTIARRRALVGDKGVARVRRRDLSDTLATTEGDALPRLGANRSAEGRKPPSRRRKKKTASGKKPSKAPRRGATASPPKPIGKPPKRSVSKKQRSAAAHAGRNRSVFAQGRLTELRREAEQLAATHVTVLPPGETNWKPTKETEHGKRTFLGLWPRGGGVSQATLDALMMMRQRNYEKLCLFIKWLTSTPDLRVLLAQEAPAVLDKSGRRIPREPARKRS